MFEPVVMEGNCDNLELSVEQYNFGQIFKEELSDPLEEDVEQNEPLFKEDYLDSNELIVKQEFLDECESMIEEENFERSNPNIKEEFCDTNYDGNSESDVRSGMINVTDGELCEIPHSTSALSSGLNVIERNNFVRSRPYSDRSNADTRKKVSAPTSIYMDELMPFYQKGMDNYSAPEAKLLIKEAVLKTGLSEPVIKRWIDNYKRKTKHAAQPEETRTRVKLPQRPKRGRDLFYTENLKKHSDKPNPEKLRLIASEWRMTSDEEKARYNEAARDLPPLKTTPNDLTAEQKKKKAKDIIKNMEKEVTFLEKLGYNGALLLTISEEGHFDVIGTKRCLDWIGEHSDIQYNLMETCMGRGPILKKDANTEIRKQVQELFNRKYSEASGYQAKRCSYKAVDQGQVKAVGMPDGILLRRPYSYGASDLERILGCQERISFVITSPETTQTTTQPPLPPPMNIVPVVDQAPQLEQDEETGPILEPLMRGGDTDNIDRADPSVAGLVSLSPSQVPANQPKKRRKQTNSKATSNKSSYNNKGSGKYTTESAQTGTRIFESGANQEGEKGQVNYSVPDKMKRS